MFRALQRFAQIFPFEIQSGNHEKRFFEASSGRKTIHRRRDRQVAATQRALEEIDDKCTSPNSHVLQMSTILIDKMLTRIGQNALKRFFVNIPQYQAKLKTYSSNFKELRACSLSISTTCIICARPKSLTDLYKRSLSLPLPRQAFCVVSRKVSIARVFVLAHTSSETIGSKLKEA